MTEEVTGLRPRGLLAFTRTSCALSVLGHLRGWPDRRASHAGETLLISTVRRGTRMGGIAPLGRCGCSIYSVARITLSTRTTNTVMGRRLRFRSVLRPNPSQGALPPLDIDGPVALPSVDRVHFAMRSSRCDSACSSCSRRDDTVWHWTTSHDTGRHVGPGSLPGSSILGIRCPQGRGGSTPPSRTTSDLRIVCVRSFFIISCETATVETSFGGGAQLPDGLHAIVGTRDA